MGRPLTPAVMPLSELLKIDGWMNIPSVIQNAFKNTCMYTDKVNEQMQTLNDKVLVLHRDSEMSNFNVKNMIQAAV